MQPQLIAGRYQVLRAIGRGGMGIVWLCRDEVLGREVAVKQIGALPGESATETRRAMREARSAAALNHPNAVAVFDVVDDGGRPWLVMEYVEGQTLADEISRDGRISPKRVADIGAQLAGALTRAHERRIVHRDIKPGNVLIDKAGRPKISDFGIARGHGDDQLTQTGFVTGTPGYLSPELARGGDADSASDVWALGATLYAAVEGQSPYEARSNPIALLMAIATERPRPMEHAGALRFAIDALMHEDPAQRWDMATAALQLGRIASRDATAVMPRLDVAATRVQAVPPVLPAYLDEPTQAAEAARTGVRPPYLDEPTQAAEAAGPGVRPPYLDEPTQAAEAAGPAKPAVAETAVAETAVAETAVAATVLARTPGTTAASPLPDDRPVRPSRRPLLIVALLVALLGGAYLLSPLGDTGGGTAALGGATSPASRATSAPTTSVPSASTPAASTPGTKPNSDGRLASFVRSYFSDVTKDTDRTWDQLSPRMQGAAGGRSSYDGFWRTIDKVKVVRIQPDASGGTAVVNLIFTRRDGTTSTETHRLSFVNKDDDDEGLLIDGDQNLS